MSKDQYQAAINAMKPWLAGGRIENETQAQNYIENRYQRLHANIDELKHAHEKGFIPNARFNDIKHSINHDIENAFSGWKNSLRHTDPIFHSMLHWSAGIKDVLKTSQHQLAKNYVEYLNHLISIQQLLKDTKPLIVKRQPKTADQKETERYANTDPNAVGHCQICGRKVMAAKGVIAHHGYERPGTGWQTSSCPGARFQPYEVSRDRIPWAINSVKTQIKGNKDFIKKMMTNPPATLEKKEKVYRHKWAGGSFTDVKKFNRPADFNPHSPLEPYAYGAEHVEARAYKSLFHSHIADAESQIKLGTSALKDFQARYDNWKKVR